MKISRRGFLLTTGAAILVAGGFSLMTGLREQVIRIIRESFGEKVAAFPEVETFAADALERLKDDRPGDYDKASLFYRMSPPGLPAMLPQEKKLADWFVTQFGKATNVLQVVADPEIPFEYYGLYSPGTRACLNPLSAAWAV